MRAKYVPSFQYTVGHRRDIYGHANGHASAHKTESEAGYQLDYSINGQRVRVMVGSNKRDAELVGRKYSRISFSGSTAFPHHLHKSLSLADLIKAFLNKKKSRIKESSLTRYSNYYTRLQAFFDDVFPTAASDIQRIELQYLEEFLDAARNPNRQGEKGWSEGTANDSVARVKALFAYAAEQKYVKESPCGQAGGCAGTVTWEGRFLQR